MKKLILITSIGALILIAVIFAFSRERDQISNEQISSAEKNNKSFSQADSSAQLDSTEYQTQTDSQAAVTVDVMPKKLGIREEKNIFTVSLNTHSVELNFDFIKIMILEDDLGNLYPAIEWTGNSGEHHINGDIVFSKINKQANSVELQINSINGVNRNFKWILQ